MTQSAELTQIISDLNDGDPTAVERLAHAVYDELHRLASAQMRHERPGHTLQPTALVHETFMRLFGNQQVHWENRAHFYGAAAKAMRRILIEHARKHASRRDRCKESAPREGRISSDTDLNDLLSVEQALSRLEAEDPRKARVVELRFFGGLNEPEIARILEVSPRTVHRLWLAAKSWLARDLRAGLDDTRAV